MWTIAGIYRVTYTAPFYRKYGILSINQIRPLRWLNLFTSMIDIYFSFFKGYFSTVSHMHSYDTRHSIAYRPVKAHMNSFIHSGDLYSTSSRDNYSEAFPAQSQKKKKEFREM